MYIKVYIVKLAISFFKMKIKEFFLSYSCETHDAHIMFFVINELFYSKFSLYNKGRELFFL
jgi:hypothetical protein